LLGCGFLFFSLPPATQMTFVYWTLAGLVVYLLYGFRNSPLAGRNG
jgi:APA family basic amino acid/polyamine antiporter